MRIRNHFRLRPTQVPQEHRVAQVAAANPWRSQYESAGCYGDRVSRASPSAPTGVRHQSVRPDPFTDEQTVPGTSVSDTRSRANRSQTTGMRRQTGATRPHGASLRASAAIEARLCDTRKTARKRPFPTPRNPFRREGSGENWCQTRLTITLPFCTKSILSLQGKSYESAEAYSGPTRSRARGQVRPRGHLIPKSAGSFVRASTNATSQAAIVAGSSWSPAARTAIATPSAEGSPKSLGSNAMASLVTAPARLDSRRSASRPASASVSIVRRSRRMSSASLSRTRSF